MKKNLTCQPRPQGFSLKKWVGRGEKALASAGHVYSLKYS